MEGDDILTSAACNVCGKRLTKREFRACHSGHLCNKHRKRLAVQKPSKRKAIPSITKGKRVKTTKDGVSQYRVIIPRTRPLPTDLTQAAPNIPLARRHGQGKRFSKANVFEPWGACPKALTS